MCLQTNVMIARPYTHIPLIRNAAKSQLVAFLNIYSFLYRLCFLIFCFFYSLRFLIFPQFFMVVSYFSCLQKLRTGIAEPGAQQCTFMNLIFDPITNPNTIFPIVVTFQIIKYYLWQPVALSNSTSTDITVSYHKNTD